MKENKSLKTAAQINVFEHQSELKMIKTDSVRLNPLLDFLSHRARRTPSGC